MIDRETNDLLIRGQVLIAELHRCVHDALQLLIPIYSRSAKTDGGVLIGPPLALFTPDFLGEEARAEQAVLFHLQRLNRYLGGLVRLAVPMEQNGVAYTNFGLDTYHPVFKSIFELMVEYQLVRTYLREFGTAPETERRLMGRMWAYSRINRYQVFLEEERWRKGAHCSREIDADPHAAAKVSEAKRGAWSREERSLLDKHFDGAAKRDVRHWYPKTGADGQPIGGDRCRNAGSLAWCCCNVIPRFKEGEEKARWVDYYNVYYDRLNYWSHPATGYELNSMPEFGRAHQLCHEEGWVLLLTTHDFILDAFWFLKLSEVSPDASQTAFELYRKVQDWFDDERDHFYRFAAHADEMLRQLAQALANGLPPE